MSPMFFIGVLQCLVPNTDSRRNRSHGDKQVLLALRLAIIALTMFQNWWEVTHMTLPILHSHIVLERFPGQGLTKHPATSL